MLFQVFHVHSSLVASRGVHDEMLEFSARHNIRPLVQVIPHEGAATIQKVFKDLDENRVRYRAVLAM